MKIIFKTTLLCFALLSMVSCKKSAGEKAKTGEAVEVATTDAKGDNYNVNTATSKVLWLGTKPTGTHNGSLGISEGALTVDNGKITGGSFTIDMNSMTSLDLEGDQAGKLIGHLKSDDFFNVEKYPTAKFEINKVTNLMNNADANSLVYGNLTMRDVTKSVSFKAQIDVNGSSITAKSPQFKIDRTEWNVKYGSKKIFADLKDKFINDEITLSLDISGSK